MSKKMRFVLALAAPLALLPVVAQAQPGAYSTRDPYYGQNQNGYYDHSGTWHANQPNPYPDGYFDQYGTWHAYADQRGGHYDSYGNWVPDNTAQPRSGGYYDRNGNWVPDDTAQPRSGGYYDRNGNWVPSTTTSGGYYDRNGKWVPAQQQAGGYYDRDGRWHSTSNDAYYGNSTSGRIGAPDRWTYSERGRSESLEVAARNFAGTANTLAREATRRSGYADAATIDALRRLDVQASNFARLASQRNRADLVGRAYSDLVNSFVDAQRRFGNLQPNGWLANEFHVMASAMGRLDKRYFGSRAFAGRSPENLAYSAPYSRY
jgi:hypothetical protein